ncbi:MAG: OmpA family protein [Elusimicrobiota bacterium]|jgi:peptidoglycan-associated lipoprotein|nr:OmpA family protein [Elusimicrobiota bacterium]
MNKKQALLIAVLILSVGVLGCNKKEAAPQPQPAPAPAAQQEQAQPEAQPVVAPQAKAEPAPAVSELSAKKPPKKIVRRLARVNFHFEKSNLTEDARVILSKNAKELLKNKKGDIVVEGYCDDLGGDYYNVRLGAKRANAVKRYYVSLGVPEKKIQIISYGKKLLLDKSGSLQAQIKNRRVETKIVK